MALLWTAQSVWGQSAFNVGVVPGYPGQVASVPIRLEQLTNVVATQFDLAFNPNKASPQQVLRGVRLTNHVVRAREIAPGVLRLLIYSRHRLTVPGSNTVLATVSFQVAPNEYVGTGPMTPSNVLLADPRALSVVPERLRPGTIFIGPVNLRDDGKAEFFLPSVANESYQIQASTDLVEWRTLGMSIATGEFMELLDPDAGMFPLQFYRAMVVTPP